MGEQVPVWAFMGLLGLFQAVIIILVNRQSQATDRNTEAVNKMAVDLPTTYATKADALLHHGEDRAEFDEIHLKVHNLRDKVHAMELKNALTLSQGAREA